jgi:hypothetical protein
MGTRIVSPRNCPLAVLVVTLLVSTGTAIAQSSNNNNKSQQVYLPDPTPREMDPNLLLKVNPQAGTSTQAALENRNAKRRQLVEWAANELVTLSERVQADVTKPTSSTSKAAAAANAEKIEQLAKNLTAALKAP